MFSQDWLLLIRTHVKECCGNRASCFNSHSLLLQLIVHVFIDFCESFDSLTFDFILLKLILECLLHESLVLNNDNLVNIPSQQLILSAVSFVLVLREHYDESKEEQNIVEKYKLVYETSQVFCVEEFPTPEVCLLIMVLMEFVVHI